METRNKSLNELLSEWRMMLKSSYHYHSGYGFLEVSKWFNSLTNIEKEIFEDYLIQELKDKKVITDYDEEFWSAFEIASSKIYYYVINLLKNAMEIGDYSSINPKYLKLLWKYPPSKEIMHILDHYYSNTKLDKYLRFAALQAMSKSFPEVAIEYTPEFKLMYSDTGNTWLCLIYENLLGHFEEDFPLKLKDIASRLTKKEIDIVFRNLPVMLSSKKWDDKREKIISDLEKLFNRKIDTSLKY